MSVARILARKLLQAYRTDGFTGVVIYGLQGAGKSTLALQIIFNFWKMQGLSDEEAWRNALSSVVFTAQEFTERVQRQEGKGERSPLLWDDAGVHASAYMYHTSERDLAVQLVRLVHVIRTAACGLVLTTPSPVGILKGVRDMPDWIRVRVTPAGVQDGVKIALAKAYILDVRPDGKARYRVWVEDVPFRVRLPDDVYREYMQMRSSYTTRVVQQIQQQLEEVAVEQKPLPKCPKCGRPVKNVYKSRVVDRGKEYIYYYAYHGVNELGKVVKCRLDGPLQEAFSKT